MADIKLFVCCHEQTTVPAHRLLCPLQVGAALNEKRFAGFAYDDEGENISSWNRYYCELTGHFWAYKNVQADYYGFFHHRRYLYPDEHASKPYIIRHKPNLGKLRYDEFPALIERFDLILPCREEMCVPVRSHYAKAHRMEDLALAQQLVLAQYPQMRSALQAYLDGTACYFGNIFIMRREVFVDYCRWLFPLLADFDAAVADRPLRVDGYIAERLLGVYATYRQRTLRILEIPRVFFLSGKEYVLRRGLNAILPPGSVRRGQVKGALGGG